MPPDPDFEVIVVGGGVIGASVGYFLARRGVRVALLERGAAGGEGASRYSGGLLRAYDRDPVLAELGCVGSELFARWDELELPGPSPSRTAGSVHLCGASEPDPLGWAARLASPGYPIRPLSVRELQKVCPGLRPTPDRVALFEERGGYGDPRSTTRLLLAGAVANGAVALENCPVRRLASPRPGEWEVESATGRLRAPVVVVAAGAWSGRLAPGIPSRGRTVPLVQFAARDLGLALPVVDPENGTYLRPLPGYGFYGGGVLALDVDDPDAVPPLGADGVRDCCERVGRLLDRGTAFEAANAIQGFDAYTSDLRPLVGFAPQRPGLYLATGFSGRGYKACLAVGLGVARDVAPRARDADSGVDLSPFRPAAAPQAGAGA